MAADEGGPAACSGGQGGTPLAPADAIVGSVAATGALATYNAGAGNVVAYGCVATADGHSAPMVNGAYDGTFMLVTSGAANVCYVVTGVGTQALTVTVAGDAQDDPPCAPIAHLDIGVDVADASPSPAASASPTATATGDASPSPTEDASPSPSPDASPSPSPSPEPSPSPSPSPTETPSPSPSPTATATPTSTGTATAGPGTPTATQTAAPASPTAGGSDPSAPIAGSGIAGGGGNAETWLYLCLLGALLMVLATTMVYSMSEEQ